MTVHALPFSGSPNPQNDVVTFRSLVASLVPIGGVVGYGELKSTQAGTPNMTVQVGAGKAIVPSRVAGQGSYILWNTSAQSVTIATANTNPRIDLVCAKVVDQDVDGTGGYAGSLVVLQGTPAASNPAVPTIPSDASYLPLAQVAVGANVTSITNANITDVRTFAKSLRAGSIPFEFLGTGANYTTAGIQTVMGSFSVVAPFGTGVPFRVYAQATILINGVTDGDVWDLSVHSPAFANPPLGTARAVAKSATAYGVTKMIHVDSTDGSAVTLAGSVVRFSGTGTTYSTVSDSRFLVISGHAEQL